jgi:acetyl-CoA acetyltransferase
MIKAAIAGVGRVPYARPRWPERTPLSMAVEASRNAVADAGLPISEIDGVAEFGMNDTATFGSVGYAMGLDELAWSLDLYGGGQYTCTTIAAAAAAVTTGQCNYAVVYRSLNGRSGMRYGQGAGMATARLDGEASFDAPIGYMVPPQWMAAWTRRHQQVYGSTCEDLGAIAMTEREHAAKNPHAMAREPITLDQYLQGRWINEPLRVYDCSLEVDGACAVVVTTLERARDLPHPPVVLHAGAESHGAGGSWDQWPDMTRMWADTAAPRLWDRAGMRAADVDVACIYDCFTYTVMAVMEGFGFFEKGGGGDYFRSGRATYGGDCVVNPHGGLLSEGYIHGLNHHCEAVDQLRGNADERQVENARTALVTAGAGPYGGAIAYTVDR